MKLTIDFSIENEEVYYKLDSGEQLVKKSEALLAAICAMYTVMKNLEEILVTPVPPKKDQN